MKKLPLSIKLVLFLFLFLAATAFLILPKTTWSAANLQNAKITLSDSRPENANTQHTYYFKTTTAIPTSGRIVIDLAPSVGAPFNIGAHDHDDMTLEYSANADMTEATECNLGVGSSASQVGVSVDADNETITFTLATEGTCADIAASQFIEATVGDGVSGGDDDIANPSKSADEGIADTYLITYETQGADPFPTLDTATVRAAIIDAVTITAEVEATLDCVVTSVGVGTTFNDSPGGNTYGTAGFDTSAVSIPFGVLNSDSASQSGQLLKAGTNGTDGFYFAVKHYGDLTSSGTDTINTFDDGEQKDNSSPADWSPPAGTVGLPNTYGHLGYGATDLTLDDLNPSNGADEDRFDGAKFAGLSTTYEAVLSHDGPCASSDETNGQGYVVYKVRISGLQEAGVYSGTISYLCTGRY